MKQVQIPLPAESREIYLSEVSRNLQHRLGPLELYESIQEMRIHIDAIAAAHMELGMPPNEAMNKALKKFGESGHLSKGHSVVGRGDAAKRFSLTVVSCMAFVTVVCVAESKVSGNPGHAHLSQVVSLGLGYGASIGMLAWFTRLKPSLFGLFCLLVQLLRFGPESILGLAHDSTFFLIKGLAVSGTYAFLFGFVSALFVRHFQTKQSFRRMA